MKMLKMKTLKQLLIGSCLASASICASATTVTANMTADNDFIVVVKQGTTLPNVVYSGIQNWKKVENFSFDVNNEPSSLKTCKISVIAWGDGSSKQGLAGILKADNTVYTGSGAFKAHQSNITSSGWAQSGGGPNSSQIASLLSVPLNNYNNPYTFNNGTVTSGTAPWGAMNFALANSVNTNLFRWIWSTSNLRKRTYSVFTIPCGKIVKPVKPMKGEHYQCYNVEKGDMLKPETIMMEDQFGRSKAVLGKPVMLCNPSAKRHGRKNFKILRKERHLVCYNLLEQQRVKSHELEISNQFAPDQIVSGKREMFCVPSWKKHIGNAEPRPVPRKLNKKARKMHKLNN